MRRYSDLTDRLAGLGSERWGIHQRAMARHRAGDEIVFLSIGEPVRPTPETIIDAAAASMRRGRTKYAATQGEPEFLDAVARRYSKRLSRTIDTDNVIFMPGSHTALYGVCLATLQTGDEILVPEPYYASYDAIFASAGAGVVLAPLQPEHRFQLQIDALEANLTPATRAVIINTPHNPTGAVLESTRIREIAEFCAEHDLWLISDEVYEDLVYEGAFASPLALEDHSDRVVVVSSLSKSHSMTGWRCGWAIGPPELIARVRDVSEAMMFGSQPFLQDAAAVALDGDSAVTEAMRADYRRRADLVVSVFADRPALGVTAPQGGIFMMIDVRSTGLSGMDVASRLLDHHDVATMPGEAFGPSGAGHVRISLTASDDDVLEGCTRIRRLIDELA